MCCPPWVHIWEQLTHVTFLSNNHDAILQLLHSLHAYSNLQFIKIFLHPHYILAGGKHYYSYFIDKETEAQSFPISQILRKSQSTDSKPGLLTTSCTRITIQKDKWAVPSVSTGRINKNLASLSNYNIFSINTHFPLCCLHNSELLHLRGTVMSLRPDHASFRLNNHKTSKR